MAGEPAGLNGAFDRFGLESMTMVLAGQRFIGLLVEQHAHRERRRKRWIVQRREEDVVFLDADPNLNDEIDNAYRMKYRHHGAQYINMMVSPEARSATIKLAPCSASS